MAIMKAQKRIPLEPHLAVCYSTLRKVSKSFSLVIQQLGTELRNAVCVFYLILRSLDTVEDDTSIPLEIKVPVLIAFHRHIIDLDWHFSCGTKEHKSTKAVQCLNEMVTNALMHIEDCLKYMAAFRDPFIFRFCTIPQIMAIGTLALCYNNIQVFRGVVKLRRGLTAKVIDHTKTMDDVYGAFYDFSCMLKAKVDKNDPNASKTLNQLEAVQKLCRDTGVLHNRKSYVNDKGQSNNVFIVIVVILLAIVFAYLRGNRVME